MRDHIQPLSSVSTGQPYRRMARDSAVDPEIGAMVARSSVVKELRGAASAARMHAATLERMASMVEEGQSRSPLTMALLTQNQAAGARALSNRIIAVLPRAISQLTTRVSEDV